MVKENQISEYAQKLQEVSVIGAGGKMGTGIVLLISIELMELALLPENSQLSFNLNAIDISNESLKGLRAYLKTQITKVAEKNIVRIRKVYQEYKQLIENSEIIEQYVEDVLKLINFSTRIDSASNSNIVFEAAVENIDVKIEIIKQVFNSSDNKKWLLTNTSSIPINLLEEKGLGQGLIIGYHFYNPPAVQKLVELITTLNTEKELKDFAYQLAKRLKKHIVPSNDIAGFIGNGHFMRDMLFGLNEISNLNGKLSFAESVLAINIVTNDFLIRPMGIFQLMDYVGIDVCQKILFIMSESLNDNTLHHELIDQLLKIGVKGGQNADGSQKDGILKYHKNKPVEVFDIDKKEYVKIEALNSKVNQYLAGLPESHQPWKNVIRSKEKESYFTSYFEVLKNIKSAGAVLAIKYLENSKNIGNQLVQSGVAANEKDVNDILKMGFYHAYGPINQFI